MPKKKVWFSALFLLISILLPLSAAWADTTVSGSVSVDTRWNLSGSPYIMTGDVTVATGVTLTVDPGVQVKFDSGFSLIISGILNAVGTDSSQIVFTSNQPVTAAGDWVGIRFHDNSSGSLKNCIIEYADTGFYYNGDTVTEITDCTIRNNNTGVEVYNRYGIPEPVFRQCSFYGNTEYNYQVSSWGTWYSVNLDAKENWWGTANPLEIVAGIYDHFDSSSAAVVDFSSFLNADGGSPTVTAPAGETYLIGATYGSTVLNGSYIVPGYYRIQPGHELTVSPGTVIRFMSGSYFIIGTEGKLTAGNLNDAPVTFTSDQSTPSAGDWVGLRFHDNSSGTLKNCIIEYADTGFYYNGDTVTEITDCTVRNNITGVGVYNRYGIPKPVFRRCSFYGNTEYNYHVSSWGAWYSVNLDAKENWWGTDDPLEIVAGIYDYFNSSSAAVVDFSSFLDADGGSPTVTALTGETYLIGATYGNTVLNGSYIVPRYYKIQSGHELTVSPGTVIRFMSGSYLIVGTDGTLTAGDSSGEPVTFTSELTVPSAGAWEGIQFAYNSSCTLKNCIIEYADIGFYFNGDTETYITDCTVRNNNTGVSVSSGIPKPVFRRCSFYGNTEYNYSVGSWAAENSANLDAKENWWGTDNPLEISAGIYDYIDSGSAVVVDFSPYLDSKMNIYDYSSMLEWQNMMANYGADLDDVIFILQILSGQNTDNPFLDLDEDQKTGLPEAILIMQYLAGLRSTASPEECFLGGVIFTDMTLGLSGSPYTLTNNIRILPGATLTIEPGVIIQFAGAYSIWVDGSLDALGTEANPVTFTSAKNTPYPGDWRGIYFDEGASGNIDHSLIEYAYQGIECYKSSPGIRNSTIQNSSRTGIYLNYSSSAVENNSIQNNGWIMALYNYNYNGWAIALYNSSPQITGNTITDNHNGISINYNCYPVISNNSIYDNSDGDSRFDIKVGSYTNADTVIINASNNWWGAVALITIEPNIYDYSDSANSARILYNPILDSPGGSPINAVVIIKDVSVSSAFITPFNGEQTIVSYTVTEATLVTIEIYKTYLEIDSWGGATYHREFLTTLADRQSKTAGQHTQVWDGRDSSGNIAEPSVYVYVIKADSGNNRIDLYDPRYVSGAVTVSDTSITPSSYNPYANERVEVKYNLFMPAWVTIGGYGMPEFIIEAVPRKQGVNTEIWDGRDGIGDIVNKDTTLAAKAEILPENAIVLMQDSSLHITDVSTDAYVIIPAYGEISTVKYSLSKNALVSITITDPNGNNRTLLDSENQTPGAHAIEWDGTDGNGRIVWPWSDGPEGDYTVQITAVDSISSTTVTENANIHVYR